MSIQLKSLQRSARSHLHFIIIVPLLIIVMNWPLVADVLDGQADRWPIGSGDRYIKYWDAWYVPQVLSAGADYFHTDLNFYPNGLSLIFHNFSLPHIVVFSALQAILPAVNAYSLVHLLTYFGNILAAYVCLLHFFSNKWIALVGALVFGMSPYFAGHINHVDVIFVAALPLAFYGFHRGIVEQRWRWTAIAGILAGATAFNGMYIYVCLLLTLGIYSLYLAFRRWSNWQFWRHLILFLAVAGAISIVRVYPMIADAHLLSEALDKGSASKRGTDFLAFFVNPEHPLTSRLFVGLLGDSLPGIQADGYLGVVPLLLIGAGMVWSRNRRMILWLFIALLFAILRLGPTLIIGGVTHSDVLLPKHVLDTWIPWIFKAFWDTTYFQIGILLPLAMLFCYAARGLLNAMAPRLHVAAIAIILVATAFEYYRPPPRNYTSVPAGSNWINWMASEDNQDDIHVINLPMGRSHSKLYGFYQSINGYPQVEGLASRTPSQAYDYINGNFLLDSWRRFKNVHCLPPIRQRFDSAHDQLVADGFTHIVLHRWLLEDQRLAYSFASVEAAYRDESVSIYRMGDMRQSCDSSALLNLDTRSSISGILPVQVLLPARKLAVLSIHPANDSASALTSYYAATLEKSRSYIFLDGDAQNTANSNTNDLDSSLTSESVILLAYDPLDVDLGLLDTFRGRIARQLKSCGRVREIDDAIIEYFLLPDFPCELAIDSDRLEIEYDNGLQLGNLLIDEDEETLDLHFMWTSLAPDTHAFSIQVYDEGDSKVFGQDFVISPEALAHHQLDISSLGLGDYVVKMIVYDYATGASIGGTVTEGDSRFEREIEIAQISLE